MNRQHITGPLTMTVEELERDPERALDQAENREVTICSQGVAIAVLIPVQMWNACARTATGAGHVVPAGSGQAPAKH